ncbi:MAG: PD-(D/E)XK nuclease family protein [Nanoarchaeota archaeon]|nr:PD-(D/E)XK nuclease family protein [Nanoarchaeota archaeon]MBU1028157.1 PD-(D/E)XK nuclease family protein [Nanoarchaeota archaeon]
MKIYSYSKINSFEQCPKKFKYKYINKIKVLEKSVESLLGFTVHSVLEYLYNEVKSKRIPEIGKIITIYSETWKENYNENIKIVKKEFTERDYFNKGVEFLVNYYLKNHPFKDNTLETEKKIEILLDESANIKLIGFIDRLVHNLETGEYEIHDYKTANNLPTKEQVENDKQLALYAIAIKELFGKEKEVALIWHYLAHGIKINSKRTNEQLGELKKEILFLINKIESATNFPTYISKLCDWCEYKNICPAWKENSNSL